MKSNTITTKFQGVNKTYTSVYTYVHSMALECALNGWDAQLFADFMQQWIPLTQLNAILSCSSYNNIRCAKSNEELYDILSDHFMYCEEDSWEQAQDLELWSYEGMVAYYLSNLI